jgi:hypothetical protein
MIRPLLLSIGIGLALSLSLGLYPHHRQQGIQSVKGSPMTDVDRARAKEVPDDEDPDWVWRDGEWWHVEQRGTVKACPKRGGRQWRK